MEVPIFAYSVLVLLIPLFTRLLVLSLQSLCAWCYQVPLIQQCSQHLVQLLTSSTNKEYKDSHRRILSFRAAISFSVFSVLLSIIVSFIASLGVEVVQYEKTTAHSGSLADLIIPLTDTRLQVRTNLYQHFHSLNQHYHQQAHNTLPGNVSTLQLLLTTPQIDFSQDNPLPSVWPIFTQKNTPKGTAFVHALKGATAVDRNEFTRKFVRGLIETGESGLYSTSDPENLKLISNAFRYEVVPTAYYKAQAAVIFDSLAAIVFDQLGTTVRKKVYDLDSLERYVYDELRCDSKRVRMFQEFRQTTSSLWPSAPAFRSSTALLPIMQGNIQPLVDSFEATYKHAQRVIESWGLKPPTSKAEDLSKHRKYDFTEILYGHSFFWEYYVGSSNSPTRSYVVCEIGTQQQGVTDFVQCTVDRITVNERRMTAKEKDSCRKAEKKYGNASERIVIENHESLEAFPATELPLISPTVKPTPIRVYKARLFTKVSQSPRVILLGNENFFKENELIKKEHLIPAKSIVVESNEFAEKFSSDWPSSFMQNYTIHETKAQKVIDLSISGLVLISALVVIALLTAGLIYIYIPKEYRQSLYTTIAEPWAITFCSNEATCSENPTETHKHIQLEVASSSDVNVQSYIVEETPRESQSTKVNRMYL